jgi:PAS domain S-box-containing protein
MPPSAATTILVVDDNEANRYAFTRCLRQAGYEVLEAATGQECLRMLEKQKPELVLLDIQLPDSSGIEICRLIKQDPATANIPVIQVSAVLTMTEARIEGLESGADAYLITPFEPRELIAQVNSSLRIRQAEANLRRTEQKLGEAEAEQRRHAEHRQLVLDAARMGWWRYDPETDTASWDERFREIFGMSSFQGPNQQILALIHPGDLPHVMEAVKSALDPADPIPYAAEYRILLSDGSVRWVAAYGVTVFEEDGAIRRAKSVVGAVQDITDRKRTEEALERSEQQLRLITDATPALVSYIDRSQRYRFVNLKYQEWFGYQRDEVLGKTMTEVLGHEAMNRLAPHVARVLRGEKVRFEVEAPYREGGTRWIDAHYVPDRDSSGEVAGFFVLVLDVTQRKRAEEALEQSEEKFRSAFANAAIGFSMKTPEGRVLDANPAYCAVTGYSLDELRTFDMSKLIHPEDLPENLALIHELAAGRIPGFVIESRYVQKGGATVWGRKSVSLVRDANGAPRWLIVLIEDVTARKQAEQATQAALASAELERRRLAAVLDALPVGVAMADATGKVTHFNAAITRIWGEPPFPSSISEYRDWKAWWAHSGEPVAAEDWAMARVLRTGEVVMGDVVEIEKFDGTGRTTIVNAASPILDSDGQIIGGVVAAVDISAQKKAETSLIEAQIQLRNHADNLEKTVRERTARLQETVQELEQYSYSISHDMRAPLRAMNQYCHIVLEDYGTKLDSEGQLHLKRISAAAIRLDRLISDVLSYHRLMRADINLESVDLEALARDIIQEYPMFEACQAQIEIVSPLTPVCANPAALTQCLSNLLGNAVKFVASGTKPEIVIWTEDRGGWVRVWIKDNGIGMEPNQFDEVWGIFHQCHVNKAYEGTGIGLSIVKKAVERMGGKVGVESQPGHGSRFWFELKAAI